MRALRIHKFAQNGALKLDQIPISITSTKQVLIRVKAAGVNPIDNYVAAGIYPQNPPFPFTAGCDGAGLVETVGNNVTKFRPGDRVFFCANSVGAFAEKVAVPESKVGLLGDALDFARGAALGIPYTTAFRTLVQIAHAKAGETVLVHGASGGVGIASTQLAKHLGLTVIGTAGSPEGVALVKEKGGADHAFNHNDSNYVDQIKRTIKSPINVIVENLANVNLLKDLTLIAVRGRIVIVGSRGNVNLNPASLMLKEASVLGMLIWLAPDKDFAQALAALTAGSAKGGWVQPVVSKQYSLTDGPGGGNDALRDVLAQTGGARGKLIIVP